MGNLGKDLGMKRVAVMTTVRNDTLFLTRWIAYYGGIFGMKNLFVIFDGHDQTIPEAALAVNTIQLPNIPRSVIIGERFRARASSNFAAALFASYDIVIAMDVDEFIVVDPALNTDLLSYLSSKALPSSVSALGLDVIQHVDHEGELDLSRGFLAQRHHALVSARYTKPNIITKPLRWGAGHHRIKGHNFHIDPNLFMFHFGSVDLAFSAARNGDRDATSVGWTAHIARRYALFDLMKRSAPIDGDSYFAAARRLLTWRRPIYAWNKPAMIKGDPVVTIPPRFHGAV
jgi:Glycosyl transferase family 2